MTLWSNKITSLDAALCESRLLDFKKKFVTPYKTSNMTRIT